MKNRISPDHSAGGKADLLWINSPVRMVRHEVVERLREAIRRGRFMPGQRLIERELCELTGVSRTSIREALRQLESERLVEIIPRCGPAVAVISPDEVRDVYDVRMSVEARMVERFIECASDRNVEDLSKASARLAKAAAADQTAVSMAKERYFAILMEGCRNQILAECQRRSKNTPPAGVKIHHRGGVGSGYSVQQNPVLRVVPVVHGRAPRCFV